MKNFNKIIMILTVGILSKATFGQNPNPINKDEYGIRVDAPKETYQYLFKLGWYETKYKLLVGPNEYKEGKGKSRNYLDKDGLTYIEKNYDEEGKVTDTATYKFNISTNKWDNTYTPKGDETVNFNAEIRDGTLTEYRNGVDSYGGKNARWIYKIINDSTYTYQGFKTYGNQEYETIFSTATRTEE